jgi:hypothetical protein
MISNAASAQQTRTFAMEIREADAPPCPPQRPVDLDAAPNFPIFSPNSPLATLSGVGEDIVLCARIGANGHVERAYALDQAPNPALHLITQLKFIPALRRGRPVTSWYRLVINREGPLPIDANPSMQEMQRPAEILLPL